MVQSVAADEEREELAGNRKTNTGDFLTTDSYKMETVI
jgi:hypothetical protein